MQLFASRKVQIRLNCWEVRERCEELQLSISDNKVSRGCDSFAPLKINFLQVSKISLLVKSLLPKICVAIYFLHISLRRFSVSRVLRYPAGIDCGCQSFPLISNKDWIGQPIVH